ncbi:hypothetical protein P0R31_31280 [Bradyrhizobium yuanmingense]|uniref:hypothetical protein n=1 Tax=Bradyrhizobium yuanmingense TaxID=108015 RepID=UPI0023B9E226|nr:hypothetical protein [Bradyrhizobium yuanmingense]MDF0521733.1 hypothetical protein [Bradyrhizobium yuanmingense]
MKTVYVEISDHVAGQLRVVWSEWTPYTISRQAVDESAEEIRSVLLELVNHSLKSEIETAAPILKKLARKGRQLYDVLFIQVGGEEDAGRVKAHYANLREPFRLEFRVSENVLVPWGLIYPADPELLPEDWQGFDRRKRWELYGDFWCFAHDATVRHIGIRPDQIGNASSLGVLRVAHQTVFDKAREQVTSEHERSFFDWIDQRYGTPINTAASLEQAWRAHASQIGLLYFYCHASPNKLALGPDETITATRLLVLLAGTKRETEAGCLIFINGCRTGAGDARGTFLLPSSTTGLVGFIGTETDVPDVFALRFSTSLLHLLFRDGVTLGEAMHRLYRDHFPLSLIYAIYAHPSFRMLKDDVPAVSDVNDNYSTGIIGSGRLGDRR